MTLTDKLIVAGVLLSALSVAFAVLHIEVRRMRRATPPPAKPIPPRRLTAAELRSRTVYVVTRPDPGVDMDATAVLLRPYRGGRHAAR